ncbi:MAG: hypothetical protein JWR63_1781 [Conexibacter sp.]|nr:hypothetical protein [Conexibacter sp.]
MLPSPEPQAKRGELREFIYLDDVSVLSLSASRFGAVDEGITDTLGRNTRAAVSAGASAPAVLGLGATVKADLESARSTSSQVVRRTVIQSLFKTLREDLGSEEVHLAEPPKPLGSDRLETVARDVGANMEQLLRAGLLVDPQCFDRGDLVELRVRLQAEPIFQLVQAMNAFLDFTDRYPDLTELTGELDLKMARLGRDAFAWMLADLVPLNAEAVDYVEITIDGTPWIAHRKLIDVLDDSWEARPLRVVAVVESKLFWKDLRRVLFSDATYVVLCRLSRPGIQNSWTPAKLLDVVRDLSPEIGETLDSFNVSGLDSLREHDAVEDSADRALARALRHFSDNLPSRHVDTSPLSQLPQVPEGCATDVQARRALFAEVAEQFDATNGTVTPKNVVADLRARALDAAGLDVEGRVVVPAAEPDLYPRTERAESALLDVEVIAIYW